MKLIYVLSMGNFKNRFGIICFSLITLFLCRFLIAFNVRMVLKDVSMHLIYNSNKRQNSMVPVNEILYSKTWQLVMMHTWN